MRLWWFLLFSLARVLPAGEGPANSEYPLWDGEESVARYAQRAGLPSTETLDLGNGVKLELMLIPAGKFIMGTPEPEPVDEYAFHEKIIMGQSGVAAGGGVLLVLLGAVAVQALRKRSRPKYSLARLLAMTAAAGVAVLSGMHWHHSIQALVKAQAEYLAAQIRYNEAYENEKSGRLVTLALPFYMGKFEVTQKQYSEVMATKPNDLKGMDYPVESASWEDALEFCKRLRVQAKQTVRLPTEAEWEYSCRAGTRTAYYSGDTEKDLARVAWYEANSLKSAHPTGQKEPNVFGLYDMHGNVWEWCQIWHAYGYFPNFSAEDPQDPAQDVFSSRDLRGGAWLINPKDCRAAHRFPSFFRGPNNFAGFRVVVMLAPMAP